MPARTDIIAAQRAAGRIALGFRRHGAATRIETFYQQGCLKARLPRPTDPAVPEAVTLNISGGVAGGDELNTTIVLEAGAAVMVASQAAERIYRALDAPARITTRIELGPRARLDFLPQETIFFDGFGLDRSLDINFAADATYLSVESYVFGRQAMGEVVNSGWLRDRISVRREQKLVFQDMTRLDGDISAILSRKAVAGGAMAVAGIFYAAPGAAQVLPALRAALNGANAGASALDADMIFARILAPSAVSLRLCVIAALAACRGGRALPRVWQG